MKKNFNSLLSIVLAALIIVSSAICGVAAFETGDDSAVETEVVTEVSTDISEETTAPTTEENATEEPTTEDVTSSEDVSQPEKEPETTEKAEEETTVHTHNYSAVIEPAGFNKTGFITETCLCGEVKSDYIPGVNVTLGIYDTGVDYYNEAVKTPKAILKSGEYTLVEGVDYDISADREMNETGVYTVKITLKGEKFSGESERYYNLICPAEKKVQLYSAESTKNGVMLKWEHVYEKNSNLSGTVGYFVYRKTSDTKWKLVGRYVKAPEFIDSTVVYGETYIYTVKHYFEFEGDYFYGAYDKEGITVKADYIITPPAPQATLDSNIIRLSWSKIPGATKYILYRSTSENSGYKKIYTGTSVKYNDKTVEPGTVYYYKLKYYVNSKVSAASDYKKVVYSIANPEFRNEFSVSENAITLSWHKIKGADGYVLYRRASIKDSWKRIKIIRNGDVTSYKDKIEGAYYYLIKAFYTVDGKSVYAGVNDVCRVRTLDKVETIKASTDKKTLTNTIKWSKVKGATKYLLYAKVTGGNWQLIAETDSSTRTYTHTVGANTTYYYNVKACSNLGNVWSVSPFGSYVKVKVSYLPQFEYELPSKKVSKGSFIPVKIKNLGNKKLRIYAEGLTQLKNPESDMPLEVNLKLSTKKSSSGYVDYIDIPAGATKTFYVKSEYNYFDFLTKEFLVFAFEYDGGMYASAISYLNGSSTVFGGSSK